MGVVAPGGRIAVNSTPVLISVYAYAVQPQSL